jgi:hypothetical protein
MVPEKMLEAKAQGLVGGAADPKSARILARSFYKELRDGGFTHNQILAASTELIDLVTRELRGDGAAELPAGNG